MTNHSQHRSVSWRAGLWVAFAMAAMSCAQAHSGLADTPAAVEKIDPSLTRSLRGGVARHVLVELVPEPAEDPDAAGGDAGPVGLATQGLARDLGGLPPRVATPLIDEDVAGRASYYEAAQQSILDAVDQREVSLITRYQHIPYLFVEVSTLHSLYALADRPEVLRLHEDQKLEHQLVESLPLIHQPEVLASGKDGAGTAVAVLDTGCDFTRNAFGNCSHAGDDGCKVAYAADFANNDAVLDDHGHGTNVSAIVLAVAPATKLLALDVFDGPTAPASAILAAIDWSIQNRKTYQIVAMNLSLGGSAWNSVCSHDLFAPALANARAAGVVPVVASGNGGLGGALTSPACTPAAVSVGAVYDDNVGGVAYADCSDASTTADQITCFSNSASFLSLLAPGAMITAGGFRMAGTSQAAPHVAGALAVVRSVFPSEAVNASIARLTDSGPAIRDPRSGITKRRLDLAAAIRGATAADNTRPTGSVVINGNQAATNSTDVMLAIAGYDASGIDSMCVSNAGTCTEFQRFDSSLAWQLPSGDGTKTVRVALKDAAGNQTVVTDSIRLDTKAPVGGTLRAIAGDAQVTLSWSAAHDTSGISAYRLLVAPDIAPSCTDGSLIYTGAGRTFTHTGVSNGTLYGYRLCPIDGAGNLGAGSTASVRPAPELTPPAGSLSINAGSASTRNAAVTLSLEASDPSGVARMCISNTKACASWEAFATTKPWTLRTSQGTATVYAWFEDSYANRSKTPVQASILVDPVPPTEVSLSAATAPGQITLTWSEGTDPSGVVAYKLVFAPGTEPPSSCDAGVLLYEGADRTYAHTGLVSGASYAYRLCATDGVGNRTLGAVRSAVCP